MASVQTIIPASFDVVVPGCVCLAAFTDNQGMQAYYRARVEDVFPSQDGKLQAMVSGKCFNIYFPTLFFLCRHRIKIFNNLLIYL